MEGESLARHSDLLDMKFANSSIKQKSALKIFISYVFFRVAVKFVFYGGLSQKFALSCQNLCLLKEKNQKNLSHDAVSREKLLQVEVALCDCNRR